MEIVIIEKKTFEALLCGVETLTGKVDALCRCCSDKRVSKWLDGVGTAQMADPTSYNPDADSSSDYHSI